jgi:hypothetical protein
MILAAVAAAPACLAAAVLSPAAPAAAAASPALDLGPGNATAVSGNIIVGDSGSRAFAYNLAAATPAMINLGAASRHCGVNY